MFKRDSIYKLLFIIIVVAVIIYISNFARKEIHDTVTVLAAVLGFIAVIYQLRRDYKVRCAEFIYRLNETFNSDDKIKESYPALKKKRIDPSVNLAEVDFGSYVMFFIIMNQLIDEGQITIKMIDEPFSNKFFMLMHNEEVKVRQFTKQHIKINRPIFELYEKWYNYRIIRGKEILYVNDEYEAFNTLVSNELYKTRKDSTIKFKYAYSSNVIENLVVFYKSRILNR